ncbi:MAG: choice-of-anchor D domain-containing protein [Acidobacteriia bacterium]|nr:choice-of-anchor D domain-containing protein [Terriglobia bacterium]
MTIVGRQCDGAKVIPVVLLSLLFAGCQGLTGNPSSGNSGAVASSPTSLAFGNAQVGSHASLSETVKNTGGSTVTISSASLGNAAYSISGLTLPAVVAAGQNITFTVKFAPSAAGSASSNLTLISDAANSPLTIPLSGTGVTSGNLSANLTPLAFGSVQVGGHTSLSETVKNSGGSTVTISSASVGNAAYSISGLTLPASVAAGQSITFTVKFAPSAAGSASSNLSLVSNAANSPFTIPLSGTGIAAGGLSPNPTSLAFGNVQVGSHASLSETVTNTGGSTVTISSASAGNAAYSISGLTLPANVAAGQSITFTVKFAPSAAGSASSNLSLVSNAANSPLTIPLSGTGVTAGNLSPNPTSLAFGNVQVGSSRKLSETVTNTGGSTVTISSASVGNAAYSISGLTLPTTLSTGQSVTFNVAFAPSTAGSITTNLTLVSNAGNSPLIIALSGTGTALGQLGVSPAILSFGDVVLGVSSTLNSSLGATGAAVTISSASSSNPEFTISGLSLPAVLAAGQSLPYKVTFKPQASGSASATLTFVSNASNSPIHQTATGNGVSAPQHSVSLSWNPSGSQGVVGYNVYRGNVSGGPYVQVNTSLDANTNYTDNQVVAGQTYYYVATAVDGNGIESGYSNQTQAVIPTP